MGEGNMVLLRLICCVQDLKGTLLIIQETLNHTLNQLSETKNSFQPQFFADVAEHHIVRCTSFESHCRGSAS